MLKNKNTLAFYCIPDKSDLSYPDISHDHNLAVFENGKVLYYIHLERITGKKYDNNLPSYLYYILKKLKLLSEDIDVVFVDNVLGRSCITNNGKLRFEAAPNKNIIPKSQVAYSYWLDKSITAYVVNHELAHIYSSIPFFGNFKNNSLLLHFDGGASRSNFSIWTYKNGNLNLIEYGWQWKYLSNLFNANALNFFILNFLPKEHNAFPGAFMGYTAYGRPDIQILRWLKKNDFFRDIWQDKKIFFQSAKKYFGWQKQNFDPKDKFLQTIAASVQYFFTSEILKHLQIFQKQTATEYLYYTGGSALNISTNTAIVNSNIFKDVFIPPAPNDAGLALGAGAYFQITKGFSIETHSPYLNNFMLDCQSLTEDYSMNLIKKVAEKLLEHKVIGIYRDCAEVGPRALGNRSIIALADTPEMYTIVSRKIKKRQWYRPLAPIMLEKYAKLFTGLDKIHHLSKYMLLNFSILEKYKSQIIATVHIDNSARIQTIFNRQQHPFFYDLLAYLDKHYKIPALINTSFNGKGQPIVHTPEDALKTAKNIGLDALVLQNQFIELK